MSIREVIMDYLENSSKKALSVEELSVALHMNKAKDYKVFVKTLASLEAEHLLNFTAKGKVELAEKEEAKVVISGPMQLALVLSALMLKNQTFLSQEAKRLSPLMVTKFLLKLIKMPMRSKELLLKGMLSKSFAMTSIRLLELL